MSSRHQRDAFYDNEHSSVAPGCYRSPVRSSSDYSRGGAMIASPRRTHHISPTTAGDLRRDGPPLPPTTPSRSTFSMMRDQELQLSRYGRSQRGGALSSMNKQSYRSTFDYSSGPSTFDYGSELRRQNRGGFGEPPLMDSPRGRREPELLEESPGRQRVPVLIEERSFSDVGGPSLIVDREADYLMGSRSSLTFVNADVPSMVSSESSICSTSNSYVYSPCKKTRPKCVPQYIQHDFAIGADGDKKPAARPSVTAVRYKNPLMNPPMTPTPKPPSTIQVSPGHFVKLYGADETWQAIQQDHYQPCVCFGCSSDLFCTLDAHLVICPDCKIISPLEGADNSPENDGSGGVGLGFKPEALAEWQASILSDFY